MDSREPRGINMKVRILRLAAPGIVVAGIGAGIAVYVVVPGGEEEVTPQVQARTPEDCGLSIFGSPVATPAKGEPWPNPEAGLSDSERMALHERLRKEGEVRYAAWVECLKPIINTVDLRAVPHYAINIDFGPGRPSLADAVAKAELIVSGTIVNFDPSPGGGTYTRGTFTTVAVDLALKGSPASSVTFFQGSHVSPTSDGLGVTVSEAPNEGLLVPGDRAILLLGRGSDGNYHIEHVTGWFQIVDGVVKANYFNDWRAAVEGKTEAEFVEMIKAALR
jgi:hypothetical protein